MIILFCSLGIIRPGSNSLAYFHEIRQYYGKNYGKSSLFRLDSSASVSTASVSIKPLTDADSHTTPQYPTIFRNGWNNLSIPHHLDRWVPSRKTKGLFIDILNQQ